MNRTFRAIALLLTTPTALAAQSGSCLGVPDSVFSEDGRRTLTRFAADAGLTSTLASNAVDVPIELRYWGDMIPAVAAPVVIREERGVWRGFITQSGETSADTARLRQTWNLTLPRGAFLELRRGDSNRAWLYFRDTATYTEWRSDSRADSVMFAIVARLRAWTK